MLNPNDNAEPDDLQCREQLESKCCVASIERKGQSYAVSTIDECRMTSIGCEKTFQTGRFSLICMLETNCETAIKAVWKERK
jgi:hypothetical protein